MTKFSNPTVNRINVTDYLNFCVCASMYPCVLGLIDVAFITSQRNGLVAMLETLYACSVCPDGAGICRRQVHKQVVNPVVPSRWK